MHPICTDDDIRFGLGQLCSLDERLHPLVAVSGKVPLRRQQADFATLSRIVIGQQVSRASATAITERFKKHIAPLTPAAFLAAGEPAWITIGLSRAKQRTLRELATALVEGHLELADLASCPVEEALKRLTAIHGVGPWTAEVFLLFGTGHPDVFPAGDLALKQAVGHGLQLNETPNERELRNLALKWSPYRGIAARLFWAYYGAVMKRGNQNPL